MRLLMTATLAFSSILPAAFAQGLSAEQANVANHAAWTAPQTPVRIYGNTWYVGPRGLSVLLVTAPTGDVLIDGGVPADAALVEANIRSLGIDLHDVKWILNSHAHFDHAGGIAQVARDTGARVIASAADTPLLEGGGEDDPQYGTRFPFPPVHVAGNVADGESLRLGKLVLTAHMTPGHTRGNTTWAWTSCEGGRCLHLVDVGSLSAPGYRLIGHPKYPTIVQDFESSFAKVRTLPCDIALSPHPEAVDLWARVARREQGDADALIDATGCRDYANAAHRSFEAQLGKEREGAGSSKQGTPRS